MTTIQAVSSLFDQSLARAWHHLGENLARRDSQQREQQRRQAAMQALRERIAAYEHQQPGYASDLQAALARMEADTARR